MIDNINWYPGHMKKTRELIQDNLKAVDLTVEIVDSRIPVSSRNPVIDELISGKPRIIVLGKADLADEAETKAWCERLGSAKGVRRVMALNLQSGENIGRLLKALGAEQDRRNEERSVKRPLRIMIVGVPNVGKSSLINRLTGRKSAQTGDRPGVTKGKQWLTLSNGMQLLDTPGILWPKFEDPEVGLKLAFCGSIKDDILGVQDLGFELIKVLGDRYPELLKERYKLDEVSEDALENMDNIALKRGFIMSGKRIDYERTGRTVLDEFRGGRIGRITLERAE
ncbi:MAG: ribosome biogenesis GTPase YlqF [Clostridiales bacterium]|jgi:ribosome biogenesis GTPase A|nr:ribosome biogenesis GTPase YlqF [Clostridiales bacterium]